jgi:hypothetical protein
MSKEPACRASSFQTGLETAGKDGAVPVLLEYFAELRLKNTRLTNHLKVLALEVILKNTMKIRSLRFPAFIAVLVLVSAQAPSGASADGDAARSNDSPAGQSSPGTDSCRKDSSKETGANKELESEVTTDTKIDKKTSKEYRAEQKSRKKSKAGSSDKTSDSAGEKDAATAGKDGGAAGAPETLPLASAESAALAAAAERAQLLKTTLTPFNSPAVESQQDEGGLAPLSLHPGGNSLRNSLSSRLVFNRVYLPGTLVIGRPAEFVVKGRAGSHVAIAMADKDSGAKPLGSINLRLGPDRKLAAAGTIPASGVLTLIVDMPVQGDLIGLPVFFETVIWQKPDFSDVELAAPVKSESAGEIAAKPNAIIVAGEKNQKRGLRFVPDSGVPQNQQNVGLEAGRP